MNFNPNAPSSKNAGIFGLECTSIESEIVLIPIPWEVTVSYGSGTSLAPNNIFKASTQVDLYNHDYGNIWKKGIYMDKIPDNVLQLNSIAKKSATEIIKAIENEANLSLIADSYEIVNNLSNELNIWVYERVKYWKNKNKKVGLIGGDHSSPFGYYNWLASEYNNFGILQIDAHLDLREAYEGFEFSHASIFYNTLKKLKQVSKLVQVGIRDYCEDEVLFAKEQSERISVFYDRDIRKRQFCGEKWIDICFEIIDKLPENIHISIDIDGLDPKLCPSTGTPVPGGLQFEELIFLLNMIKQKQKNVIGFDICEVGNKEFDGNVAARILYHLCAIINK